MEEKLIERDATKSLQRGGSVVVQGHSDRDGLRQEGGRSSLPKGMKIIERWRQ